MKTLSEVVGEYRILLEKVANMSVIDLFHSDEIQYVENNKAPIIGKETLREKEKK